MRQCTQSGPRYDPRKYPTAALGVTFSFIKQGDRAANWLFLGKGFMVIQRRQLGCPALS